MGIEKSRNLMTVRLSDQLGLDKIADISLNLGIYKKFPPLISSSLGSLESSLVKITSAYATLEIKELLTTPVIIDAIYDKDGKYLYKGDVRKCLRCSLKLNTEIDTKFLII